MSRLVLTTELLAQVRTELLESKHETCAILFGRAVVINGRLARIVVREFKRIADEDYLQRSETRAQLSPTIVASVTQRVRKSGESLIFVHSHPFALNRFSSIDDEGEEILSKFLASRTPEVIHATLLVTPEATIARILGSGDVLKVVGIGSQLVWGDNRGIIGDVSAFDRQVRVFGTEGQDRLRNIRVGVVGLGGTGSVVIEQLAHLGVTQLLLIDPDKIERTNLNRLIGASESDVNAPKVHVASSLAMRINHSAQVDTIVGSVLLSHVVEQLIDTDFVFCCTDSHGSRAVINQFAYQYLVPVIDMGVAIVAPKGQVCAIAGRTQMLAPGLGCLACGDLLNPEAVRVDLLTDFERAADPYIVGAHEPAPAVISLNATMASMAVTMFLSAVTGIPSRARLVNYNGMAGTTRSAEVSPHPTCYACSSRGALARGDEWPLPARMS